MTQLLIRNEDEWLDLHEGEEAVVRGSLIHADATGLVLMFPWSWDRLFIAGDATHLTPKLGQDVDLTVVRTEDGVELADA